MCFNLDHAGRVEAMVLNRFFGGSLGLNDWILQRVSAVFLVLYFGILLGFWVVFPVFSGALFWRGVLLRVEMRILGMLAMLALSVHACIGTWVVATDYLHMAWAQRLFLVVVYLFAIITAVVVSGVLLLV